MALTTYTLTGDLNDAIGVPIHPRRTHVVLEHNLPKGKALVNKAGKQIHLGAKVVPLEDDATFTLPAVIASNSADINVLDGSLRWRITASYIDARSGTGNGRGGDKRESWTTGWFALTGNMNIADVVGTEWIEPAVATALYDLTVAEADRAQAAADLAVAPTDTQFGSLLGDPDSLSAIGVGVGASAAVQGVMRKLAAGVDANVVILSDSTADSTTEWGYLLAQRLGTQWTQRRVIWYPADTSDEIGYGAGVTIQAPSGYTGTLRVWAYAIPGRNSYGWQSDAQFAAAVVSPGPDAVLIGTSHNEGAFTGDPANLGYPQQQFRLRILAVAEQIRQAVPSAGIALVAQNPWQDDGGDMGVKRDELRTLAQSRGYGFLDVYQAFLSHPNRSTLYLDNVHPNAAGEAVYRDVIARAFRALPNDEPRPMQPSLFDTSGAASMVDDLVMPGGATTPVGWSLLNATATRDTVRYETARGYAIRLTPVAGASQSRMFRTALDSAQVTAYRGRWVILAARVWRAAGGVGNRWVGRMGVSDGVKSSFTLGDDFSAGGSFVWRFLPHLVDPAATGLTLNLYCDSVGGATDPTVTYDRLMLIPGEWPAGFAPRAAPDQWTAYTPTLVGFTGTVNHARYRLAGNSCRVVGQVTLNAVPTGTLDVSLPTPALTAAQTGRIPMGSAVAWDIGTGAKQGNALLTSSGTGGRIQFIGENGTWNATIPHAWAANDVLGFQFEYEVNAG